MILRVNIDDENLRSDQLDGGGVLMHFYKDAPFTGIIFTNSETGQLAIEEEYKDSYQEGKVTYYYENGRIEEEYVTHNNLVIDGTYKRYDEGGNLVQSG